MASNTASSSDSSWATTSGESAWRAWDGPVTSAASPCAAAAALFWNVWWAAWAWRSGVLRGFAPSRLKRRVTPTSSQRHLDRPAGPCAAAQCHRGDVDEANRAGDYHGHLRAAQAKADIQTAKEDDSKLSQL